MGGDFQLVQLIYTALVHSVVSLRYCSIGPIEKSSHPSCRTESRIRVTEAEVVVSSRIPPFLLMHDMIEEDGYYVS